VIASLFAAAGFGQNRAATSNPKREVSDKATPRRRKRYFFSILEQTSPAKGQPVTNITVSAASWRTAGFKQYRLRQFQHSS
jgi:hypothetical protein